MGVPGLNRFLLSHCSTRAIRKIGLHELHNQTIVIDIHNYLYEFLHKGPTIVEPLYQMIRQFALHSITPCFIFDGTPPPEKRDTLQTRSHQKYLAKQQYEALMLSDEADSPHKTALLDMLKLQSTRLKPDDIHLCKNLLTELHIPFYTAAEESDPLCAAMVQHNHAWACMSQDMDMFLYGCRRVLRRYRDSFYLYDMDVILQELDMDVDTFRQSFVLLGTDYGADKVPPHILIRALFRYRQYRNDVSTFSTPKPFLEWFSHPNKDKERVMQICNMFANIPL